MNFRAIANTILLPALVLCSLQSCRTTRSLYPEKVQYASSPVSAQQYGVDSSLYYMVKPYGETLAKTMEVVIGEAEEKLEKNRNGNGLGNFVADALLNQSRIKFQKKVDFSVMNSGGIRINEMGPGKITVGKIYELMPFDNQLVLINLNGAEVKQLLDHMAARGGAPMAGVKFNISDKKAENILIDGNPITNTSNYTIAISDYLANGGDDLVFLKSKKQENINYLQRDAIMDEVKAFTRRGELLKVQLKN